MKRLIQSLLVFALVAAGLWFFGRAPTRFVLEQECRRFQQERRLADGLFAVRIGKLGAEEPDSPELVRLRADRHAKQVVLRRMFMRGWDVLLIPAGAPRPDTEDFLVWGSFDASVRTDPQGLQGAFEIWLQPGGTLARWTHRLGLSP